MPVRFQAMSFLQKAIGLRGYGQKDPLTEYKLLGYRQYLQMTDNVRRNVIYNVFQAILPLLFNPKKSTHPHTLDIVEGTSCPLKHHLYCTFFQSLAKCNNADFLFAGDCWHALMVLKLVHIFQSNMAAAFLRFAKSQRTYCKSPFHSRSEKMHLRQSRFGPSKTCQPHEVVFCCNLANASQEMQIFCRASESKLKNVKPCDCAV